MPIQDFEVENPDLRLFKAFASAEVKDSQGDLIPIEEFAKVMPMFMASAPNINATHSNKTVGKVLSYQIMQKETSAGPKPALMILGQIFKRYSLDDVVWEGIQNGKLKGISFGGNGAEVGKVKYLRGGETANLVKYLEPYEFSVVEEPANEEALIEKVGYAKSKENLQKPMGQYADFADCVKQNADKQDANAYCATIMRAVEGKDAEKGGENKVVEEPIAPKPGEEKQGETPATPPADNGVEARLAALEKSVAEIKELVSAAGVEKSKEEKPEDKPEKKPDEEKPVEKELAKTVEEAVRKELKKAGFQDVAADRAVNAPASAQVGAQNPLNAVPDAYEIATKGISPKEFQKLVNG